MKTDFLKAQIWEKKVFIGGWKDISTSVEVSEPATNKPIGFIGFIQADDVKKISNEARANQKKWAKTDYEARGSILRKAALIAEENFAEIVDMIMAESGSVRPKAEFELSVTIKALYQASALPSQSQGDILPSNNGKISLAKRVPIGVVGVISPFNFPLYLAMRSVAPAIALGNAVILKPDMQTAISGGIVIARIFELAGLPPHILSVVPGDGSVGQALCSDPNIAMIQFTGSTAAGRMVGKTAGENLKKVSLELGGKNSLIIREDADLDLAIKNATWGAYLHQGQICMATGRILVHESLSAEFTKRLVEHVKNLPCGDPKTDKVALGPLINIKQVERVGNIIKKTVEAGGVLEIGGDVDGLFITPTVLSNVKPGMSAYEEEVFGPVASITVFKSDDEAIAFANDTDYGLSAAIITKNIARGLEMGENINSGLLHINDQTVNDDVVNPFGGVGKSGNGNHIGGAANWEEFTHWRWVTIQTEPPAYPL